MSAELKLELSSDEIAILEGVLEVDVEELKEYPKYHKAISGVFAKTKTLRKSIDEEIRKPIKLDKKLNELRISVEEATALKLMLEETVQVLSNDKYVHEEDIQPFKNILAKLPEFIQTQKMREELVSKETEEQAWIYIKERLNRFPSLRKRVKQCLDRLDK